MSSEARGASGVACSALLRGRSSPQDLRGMHDGANDRCQGKKEERGP